MVTVAVKNGRRGKTKMEERKNLFYGVRRGGISVNVMEWDGYKNPVLVVGLEDENVNYKVASFNSRETAEWFIDKLREFLNGLMEENGRE